MHRSLAESAFLHILLLGGIALLTAAGFNGEKQPETPVKMVIIPTDIIEPIPEKAVIRQPKAAERVKKQEARQVVKENPQKSSQSVKASAEPVTESIPFSAPQTPAAVVSAPSGTSAQMQSAGTDTEAERISPLPSSGMSASTAKELEQGYISGNFGYILNLLKKNLSYPPEARRMKWSGRVVLRFDVETDGRASNIRIETSSGYASLDERVLDAVRRSSPFPVPPVPATLIVPITFNLR